MDSLQKQHAFDQLETWLYTIKNAFIDDSEAEMDERIDHLNEEIADLEEQLNSKEDKLRDLEIDNDDLLGKVNKVREILEDIVSSGCGADYAQEKAQEALDLL